VLTACGVYLALRARTFPVVLGLTLLSYAVNLFLFVMGRLTIGLPAVIGMRPRLHRPAAAGPGLDRHRHQLRDDRLRHHAGPEGTRRARQRPGGRAADGNGDRG
jgi:hypothetical protein